LEPAGAANEDAVSVDDALDAVAERLFGALGQRELQSAPLGPDHERGRERMGGEPVERGGEPQHLAFGRPSREATSASCGWPSVSVPVLSSRTVRALPSRSIAPAPLTTIPARAARERPDISAIGAARMSGHGVATTKTASARTGSLDATQAAPATNAVSGRKYAA
jgi:hypothetical protein